MKLIDCFMYFDEDLILDIRLHTLKKWITCHSRYTRDHVEIQEN